MQSDESHHYRVRLFRLASGLSRDELAKILKVSPNMVAAVETGGRDPSNDFLGRLYAELGASTEWIIKGEGPPLRAGAVSETGQDAEAFASRIENIRQSEWTKR